MYSSDMIMSMIIFSEHHYFSEGEVSREHFQVTSFLACGCVISYHKVEIIFPFDGVKLLTPMLS